MIYFDFHTHRIPLSSEVIPVYNRIVYPDPAQEDSIEPGALCSCGIHPWYVLSDGVAQMERLSLLAQEPGVVAIGEAGLDRLAATPWTVQERLFEEQARLADELDKPLVIHCVKAWDRLLLFKKCLSPHVPWGIHGFRGGMALAGQLAAAGFYFSLGLFHQEAVSRGLPIERLFLETDDRLADIRELYVRVAAERSMTLPELSDRIRKNINSLFSLNY